MTAAQLAGSGETVVEARAPGTLNVERLGEHQPLVLDAVEHSVPPPAAPAPQLLVHVDERMSATGTTPSRPVERASV